MPRGDRIPQFPLLSPTKKCDNTPIEDINTAQLNTPTLIEKRVFVNELGEFGDKIGVIIDEGMQLSKEERQEITTASGYDEVVFINDSKSHEISIYQPQNEIKFAGTAVLAAIETFLRLKGEQFDHINCLGNRIEVRIAANIFWVRATIDIMPPWNIVQASSTNEIDNMTVESAKNAEHTLFWSWIDEQAGTIRARTFASDWDVPESEANGSGSLLLARLLKRNIEVLHGKGSVIFANYIDDRNIEVGEMGGMVN